MLDYIFSNEKEYFPEGKPASIISYPEERVMSGVDVSKISHILDD